MEPKYSTTTERLYAKLPDIYRDTDERGGYQFKKYISSVVDKLGDIDLLIARLEYLSQIELEYQRRYRQRNTEYVHSGRVVGAPKLGQTSDLVDPRSADIEWLPWLGQLVGVRITPAMSPLEARDAIAYASTGYRAGSKDALEKAARAVLSGSRYCIALPHTKVEGGNIVPGTVWDLTLLTRAAESPSSYAILQTVNKPTVKPAGVMLYHRTYQASWDALEAALPFWTDWDTQTWAQIEQVGLSYKDISGQVHPNPSFEANASGWSATGPATIAREGGGIDGTGQLRVSVNATGAPTVVGPTFTLTKDEAWVYGFSYQSLVPWTLELMRGATSVLTTALPATGPGVWQRYQSGLMPSVAGTHRFNFSASATVNDFLLLDGFIVRKS